VGERRDYPDRLSRTTFSEVTAVKTSSSSESSSWIKVLYYRDEGWTVVPGKESWISDPGSRHASGERRYRKDGQPAGKPGYRIGDQLGLYFSTTLKVPLVVEVIGLPEFVPDFVQANSYGGEADAGERWPWMTRVRGLHRLSLDEAPDIDYLDIRGPIMGGPPHFKLTPARHHKLMAAFRR
jgi:hypothetical protein